MPFLVYFVVIPTLFPKPVQQQSEGPDADVPPPVEAEVVPLWWSIGKYMMWAGIMALCFLAMIYFKQESMLFVPSQPY
jgi:hypothetical protein